MPTAPPSFTGLDDVLDERPALSRGASTRALDEIVAQERVRQDGRFAVLRRLREQAERVLQDAPTAAPALGTRVRRLLHRRPQRPPTTERELRARFEDAQVRARRAASFAETLGELSGELSSELARLGALLAELAKDDETLDDLIRRLRAAAGDAELQPLAAASDGGRRPYAERAERAGRRAQEHEVLRDAVRAAEDRLLRLVESERMLLVRVDALRGDVERTARDAGRRLDDVGATLRALATSDDADRVLADLERALAELFGALDDSNRKLRDEGATP